MSKSPLSPPLFAQPTLDTTSSTAHAGVAVEAAELRASCPSPSKSPSPAIGAYPELSRSVSSTSTVSAVSSRSTSLTRESASTSSSRQSSASFTSSRQSSGSYPSRQSAGGQERPRRRGYVRPQGTNFAASAQSRESVMSLGSIVHLQYYFARTGLLDGKGGQLAKTKPTGTLDLSGLDTAFLSPIPSDQDSSFSSIRSSPDLAAQGGAITESPIEEDEELEHSYDGTDSPEMLPPFVSTYNQRPQPVYRPPTLAELKSTLESALKTASQTLLEVKNSQTNQLLPPSPSRRHSESDASPQPSRPRSPPSQGWFELQGMHILDTLTLAIRAAKIYYTSHNQPQRLAAIKSERKIRAELLAVIDVLKRMATRNFARGTSVDERETMEDWIASVWAMLQREEEMERADLQERAAWEWLDDERWPGATPNPAREYSFMKSLDPDAATLPPYNPHTATSHSPSSPPSPPSPLLQALLSGLRLITLHNAAIHKSARPFGSIPTFHTDTAKPYRRAENLRFWIKAAELRWDIALRVDVAGVVAGTDAACVQFESEVWRWCARVREELSGELRNGGL